MEEGLGHDIQRDMGRYRMKCPSCGAENPDDYRFCARCGTDMTSVPEPEPAVEEPEVKGPVCPKCGTENPVGYGYCSKCGAKLEPAPEPETEDPKEEENTGIREGSVPKPPKQRNPKGRRNAIVAVALVFVLAVAAIAVFTMSSPEEEPPDRPLDWLKTPDGTYTYENKITYNGSTTYNTIKFTLVDERYTEYSIDGNYLDKTQLRELNNELDEQMKLSYTYTDGETWNDGSKEYSTYVVLFNGVNDMQTITDTGIIVYEFLSEDGVVSTTTLKGWSKGLLYHTVTFKYMNGTEQSRKVHHGDPIILLSDVTKEGCSPVGWHMNYEYTGNPYALGSQFVVTDDVTFYLEWKKNVYKVTFVLNGGSYSGSNPVEVQYGNGINLPEASEVTRSGYTLKGWDTGSSATNVVHSPGTFFIVEKDVTLYAVWNVTSAILTFNGNGGDGTYTRTFDIGSSISMPATTINLGQTISRTGYDFQGWALSSNSSTPDYYAGNSYNVTKNVTFYAVWKAKEYTVSFDGGVECNTTFGDMTVTHGQPLGHAYYTSRNDGYTFDYWTYKGAKYDLNAPVTSDLHLVAHWHKMVDVTMSGKRITLTFTDSSSEHTIFWGDGYMSFATGNASHTYNADMVRTYVLIYLKDDATGTEYVCKYAVSIGENPDIVIGFSGGGGNIYNMIGTYRNTGSQVDLQWYVDWYGGVPGQSVDVNSTQKGIHWIIAVHNSGTVIVSNILLRYVW